VNRAAAFGEFFERLQDHWIWLMGLWLMAEPMADSLWVGYRDWADRFVSRSVRSRISWFIAISGAFVACFLAFQDQFREAESFKTEFRTAVADRDEARRQRDTNVSPAQQSTIDRLSGDLTAARGKIDTQEKLIDAQQSQIASDSAEIQKLKPKPARHLTEEDKARLRAAFAMIKVDYPTLAISAPGDGEPQGFARELMAFFNDMGMHVDRVGFVYPTSAESSPLQVAIKDFAKIPPKADRFVQAMLEARFQVTGAILDTLPEDQFVLVVAPQH
jgi:hypothetical protein